MCVQEVPKLKEIEGACPVSEPLHPEFHPQGCLRPAVSGLPKGCGTVLSGPRKSREAYRNFVREPQRATPNTV